MTIEKLNQGLEDLSNGLSALIESKTLPQSIDIHILERLRLDIKIFLERERSQKRDVWEMGYKSFQVSDASMDHMWAIGWLTFNLRRLKYYFKEVNKTINNDKLVELYQKHYRLLCDFCSVSTVRITPILLQFGQENCSARYSGSQHIEQLKSGFDMRWSGQLIIDIAEKIKNSFIKLDELIIRVFPWKDQDGKHVWTAINNRSLAVHAKSSHAPLRLIPARPTQEELNRLKNCFIPLIKKPTRLPFSSIIIENENRDTIQIPKEWTTEQNLSYFSFANL